MKIVIEHDSLVMMEHYANGKMIKEPIREQLYETMLNNAWHYREVIVDIHGNQKLFLSLSNEAREDILKKIKTPETNNYDLDV